MVPCAGHDREKSYRGGMVGVVMVALEKNHEADGSAWVPSRRQMHCPEPGEGGRDE